MASSTSSSARRACVAMEVKMDAGVDVDAPLFRVHPFLRKLRIQPWGVLGMQKLAADVLKRTPNTPGTLAAVVDPTCVTMVQNSRRTTIFAGASRAIYEFFDVCRKGEAFPAPVALAMQTDFDAKDHVCGDRHIIHVAVPDLRYEDEEGAMDAVAGVYKAVLKEYCTTPCTSLRMPAMCSGRLCPDRLRNDMPGFILGGLAAAFEDLAPREKSHLLRADSIELCIFLEEEHRLYDEAHRRILNQMRELKKAAREAGEDLSSDSEAEVQNAESSLRRVSSVDATSCKTASVAGGSGRPGMPHSSALAVDDDQSVLLCSEPAKGASTSRACIEEGAASEYLKTDVTHVVKAAGRGSRTSLGSECPRNSLRKVPEELEADFERRSSETSAESPARRSRTSAGDGAARAAEPTDDTSRHRSQTSLGAESPARRSRTPAVDVAATAEVGTEVQSVDGSWRPEKPPQAAVGIQEQVVAGSLGRGELAAPTRNEARGSQHSGSSGSPPVQDAVASGAPQTADGASEMQSVGGSWRHKRLSQTAVSIQNQIVAGSLGRGELAAPTRSEARDSQHSGSSGSPPVQNAVASGAPQTADGASEVRSVGGSWRPTKLSQAAVSIQKQIVAGSLGRGEVAAPARSEVRGSQHSGSSGSPLVQDSGASGAPQTADGASELQTVGGSWRPQKLSQAAVSIQKQIVAGSLGRGELAAPTRSEVRGSQHSGSSGSPPVQDSVASGAPHTADGASEVHSKSGTWRPKIISQTAINIQAQLMAGSLGRSSTAAAPAAADATLAPVSAQGSSRRSACSGDKSPAVRWTKEEEDATEVLATLHSVRLDCTCGDSLRSIKWKFADQGGASVLQLGRHFLKDKWDLKVDDHLVSINGVPVKMKSRKEINDIWKVQQLEVDVLELRFACFIDV